VSLLSPDWSTDRGANAVEHKDCGVGETGAREPDQPRGNVQREDGHRQHAG